MFDVDINWPKEYPALKEIDKNLRCGICYEYLKTSMITNCSHNYCSKCIRSYLTYQTKCPFCFEETFDHHLRNNRTLDSIVTLFTSIRDELILLIKSNSYVNSLKKKAETCNWNLKSENGSTKKLQSPTSNTTVAQGESTPKLKTPATVRKNLNKSTEKAKATRNLSSALNDISDDNPIASTSAITPRDNTNEQCSVSPQIRMKTPKKPVLIPDIFNPQRPRKSKEGDKKVACPVCQVEISDKHINQHLDSCLDGNREARSCNVTKRKPLPKLVYNILSTKDLKKKLKEHGLSCQGDKVALENRHQRFTILYNAECDELNPRSVNEIIHQIEMEEKEEKESASNYQSLRFVVNKKDETATEQARRQYLTKNKASYDKLIQSVKNRRKEEIEDSTNSGKRKKVIVCNSSDEEEDIQVHNTVQRKKKVIECNSSNEEEDIQVHNTVRRKRHQLVESSDEDDDFRQPQSFQVKVDVYDVNPTDMLETSLNEDEQINKSKEERDLTPSPDERDITPSPLLSFRDDSETRPSHSDSVNKNILESPLKRERHNSCDSNESMSLLDLPDVHILNTPTKKNETDCLNDIDVKEEALSVNINLLEEQNSVENSSDSRASRKRNIKKLEIDSYEVDSKENTPLEEDEDSMYMYINKQIDSQLDDPDFNIDTQDFLVSSQESEELVKVRRSSRKRKQTGVLSECSDEVQNDKPSRSKKKR